MQRTHKTNMEQLHELITDSVQNYNEDGDPSGPVVLQHHEGLTHKGDLFTKCLDPCKFQEGLKLLKVRQPQLPPPLKKGKVIDFDLHSLPPVNSADDRLAGNQQRGRTTERGSGEQRVSRTPSARRASSCDSTEVGRKLI